MTLEQTVMFLAMAFAGMAVAIPAPTSCSQPPACHTLVNECGMSYGGCWDPCQSQQVTFTAPSCPTITANPTFATQTVVFLPQNITGPPPTMTISALADLRVAATDLPDNATTSCTPQTMCVDGLVCNGMVEKYNTCYDLCTQKSFTPPPCTNTPTATPTPVAVNANLRVADGSVSECNIIPKFLCPNWGRFV